MLVWETDPSLRDNEPGAVFADVWCAIPRTFGSRVIYERYGRTPDG